MAQFYFNTPSNSMLKYPTRLKEKEVITTHEEVETVSDETFLSLSKRAFYWLVFFFFLFLIFLILFCTQRTSEVKYIPCEKSQDIKMHYTTIARVSTINHIDTNTSEQNLSSTSQQTASFQPRTMNGSFPDVTSQVTTGVLDFFGDLVFGGSSASNAFSSANIQNQSSIKPKSTQVSNNSLTQVKSNLQQKSQYQPLEPKQLDKISNQKKKLQKISLQKQSAGKNSILKDNTKKSLKRLGMKLPNRVLPNKNISILIPNLHKPVSLKKYMYFANTTKAHYPNYIDINSKKIIIAKESHCLKKASTVYKKEECSVTGLTQKDKNAYIQWLNVKTGKNFFYKENFDSTFQIYTKMINKV